ncbi:DUF6318 family protein [Actinotalea ferrariae]|uniref:DUF6318 family protein n=1 Tax=Actinotalea ferrariae TaxID=1386098 RepID=UPI0021AB89FD|nr:DUF6318 family protein [Actinotalea ferrariae]
MDGRAIRGDVRRFRARLAGLVLVGVVAVGGCTPSDPDPTPSPDVTTASPTPTPSPTAEALSPPERPAEMDLVDEAGAVAAARYFMELFGYLLRSGDAVEWDTVSGQSCDFCANAKARATEVYGAGHVIDGGALTTGDAAVLGHDAAINTYAVEVEYQFAAGARRDADGGVVEEIDAEAGTAVLDVTPSSRGWILVEGSGGS